MKVLIIYDSFYGNTEAVANEIGESIKGQHEVTVKKVKEAGKADLKGVEALIVGSPTRAFRATKDIMQYIAMLPADGLKGVKAAAFDTRMNVEDAPSKFLKRMVKIFGYAAEPMSAKLAKKGAAIAAEPAGFIVSNTEGPLKDGEKERAVQWLEFLR